MAYSRKIYDEAERELTRRRRQAEDEQELRHAEIAEKFPDLLIIEAEMAQAGLSVVKALGRPDAKEFIAKLAEQSKKAQAERKALLTGGGYSEDYLETPYTCKVCEDTGFVNGRRCECHKKLLRQLSFAELQKTSPLSLSKFETFDLKYYPVEVDPALRVSPRNRMSEIFEFCVNYAEDFSINSPSLFMYGATGLGKTHLSLAIAREAIEKGYGVIYGSTQNLLSRLEREHFSRIGEEKGVTEQMLLECDLLILDDLGAEFSTSFTVASIYNIVNTRLNTGLPTIISTNLTPQELEAKYTQRITSRIIGNYCSLLFCGRDVRQLKRGF